MEGKGCSKEAKLCATQRVQVGTQYILDEGFRDVSHVATLRPSIDCLFFLGNRSRVQVSVLRVLGSWELDLGFMV